MATGKGTGVLTADPSSGVTLSDLKTICRYVGWRDTSTNSTTALVRFINDVVWTLASLAAWPEYLKRDGSQALTISADWVTATVYTTASIVNGTDDLIYKCIDGHTSDAAKRPITGATWTDYWEITTTADEYTLSETGIDKIGVVERADTTLPLDEVSLEEWLALKRGDPKTGTPSQYAVEKGLSSGVTTLKLLLYPCPNETDTLYYSYFRKPVEMANDTDIVDWPESRVWLLTAALEYIMAAGDNNVFSLHSTEFMSKVYSALGDARASYLPIKTKSYYDTKRLRIRDMYWNVTS